LVRATVETDSISHRLRQKLKLVSTGSGRSFWSHPALSSLYPEYCFLSHCVIRASVPIMVAARDRAIALSGNRVIGKTNPVAEMLVPYLSRHIDEEHEHDEWLLNDMEVLRMPREEMLRRIPPAEVAEVVGAQYYWLHHAHPVSLLGYIAVLEGDPPREDEVEAAIERTGLPRAAFRTILSHAGLDPGHKEEFERFLDSLPLTPEQEALIGVSAIHTAAGMAQVFARLETQ
jgi:heme oxygenase-like protein